MSTKRKLAELQVDDDDPVDPSDQLMFLCLGGGNEVGRSCHIIQYKGKTVMVSLQWRSRDVKAYSGSSMLGCIPPMMVSPRFLSTMNSTSQRLTNTASSAEQKVQLYTEADHLATFPQIEAIDYHTTHTISGIRITPYPAGHVLGAAMFLIEIAGLKIMFTGDYSREKDRHLIPAEVPRNVKVDVLITESTYGIASHVPRVEREAALMKSITGILNRGGRALLPVFALGRAQELLLILDEYWAHHPEYQNIPIYYASNLARKCMIVYQTYIGAMNDNIKRLFRERMADAEAGRGDGSTAGPWDFRFIRSLKSLERFDDVGSCVMLASPGMMQNGVSRELLERWAPDQRNGVVITGYSVEGTMAKQIMTEPDSIQAIMTARGNASAAKSRGPAGKDNEAVMIPRRCSVAEYSFAAHVDGPENREFIEEVNAPVVILVHGEKHNMTRLRSRLLSLNTNKAAKDKTKVFSPANCDRLYIPVRIDKTARVVGKLAERMRPNGSEVNGATNGDRNIMGAVLVEKDHKLTLMDPDDLPEYAGLTITTITCKHRLTLASASVELIHWSLEGVFGGVETLSPNCTNADGEACHVSGNITDKVVDDDKVEIWNARLRVMDVITIHHRAQGELMVEWIGNQQNDLIADSVLNVLMQVETSPAAVKESSKSHSHSHGKLNGACTSPDDRALPKLNGAGDRTDPHSSHHPLARTSLPERLSRLMLFMEAQFGADATAPIHRPRIKTGSAGEDSTTDEADTKADVKLEADSTEDGASGSDLALTAEEQQELARLHALHIPVPGLQITIDTLASTNGAKTVAKVWLEDLSVEVEGPQANVVRDRVKAVVKGAMGAVKPLWEGRSGEDLTSTA
ncbi:hypothetical protein MRB53_036845 [Persea americana]|nr:hypothetical protein MRB53_036845 [Persea americana]